MIERISTLVFIGLLQLTVAGYYYSKPAAAQQPITSKKPFQIGDTTYRQTDSDKKLEDAIAALRRIKPDQLNDEQKKQKAKEIDAAWKIIKLFGQNGILRLKQEVQKVDISKEKDDYFKLNASALLWEVGKINEAENIAKIWNSSALNEQYNYVFYTAMDAAHTRDPKVLPMLKALLKDDQGKVYFNVHAMEVRSPLTHEFVWGFYGIKGFPVLNEVLQTSSNPIEIRSAMLPLCQALYPEALPRIRQVALNGSDETRRAGIRCLGVYGHPQDYEFLISGLRSKDPKELWNYVYALYEFEDLRTVPHLIPLLTTQDDALRAEVLATLGHLLTPDSFEVLNKYCQTTKNPQEKELCERLTIRVLTKANLGWADYSKKTKEEREAILKEIRNTNLTLKKGDRTLTRQQLLAAINEWTSNHRLSTKEYGWVEAKHILAVAKVADIDLLLEAKASFYARLSDECLYDVRRIDNIVKRLRRSQYRKESGITERANER